MIHYQFALSSHWAFKCLALTNISNWQIKSQQWQVHRFPQLFHLTLLLQCFSRASKCIPEKSADNKKWVNIKILLTVSPVELDENHTPVRWALRHRRDIRTRVKTVLVNTQDIPLQYSKLFWLAMTAFTFRVSLSRMKNITRHQKVRNSR